jgi:hypothetical protein
LHEEADHHDHSANLLWEHRTGTFRNDEKRQARAGET